MNHLSHRPRRAVLAACAAVVLLVSGVPGSVAAEPIGADLRSTQWGLTAVRAEAAWAVTRGSGVVVAVIDTGVDATHPDLAGRVLAGWSTLNDTELVVGENNDAGEHGTHVAAIIAGDDDADGVSGVAPEATILPVQVLGTGGGTDRTVADGIDWAVANGAKVINLSLGGEKSIFDSGGNITCDAVGKAFDAGVVVVVAAGNSGSYNNPENRPASCRGALSVAALDENFDRTYFSSYDATVGISAPGRRIVSAVPTSAIFPYAQWDGTSMAAPFVAGTAALVRAAHPDWTAQQVVDHLRATALDVNAPGADPETGAGVVDAGAALGASAQDLMRAREAIRAVTAPQIIRAASDGSNTTVSWKSPFGATAQRYVIRYQETLNATPIEVTVNGDKLSGTLPVDAFTRGFVTVVAFTGGVARPSLPTASIDLDIKITKPVPQPKVTKLSARWVAAGIEVSFISSGPSGKVNVTALDWNYGFLGDTTVTVAKSTKGKKVTTVLAVPADAEARAHVAVISAGTEKNRKQFDLLPQYPLSALLLTAGPDRVAVKGSSSFACLANNVACQGAVIAVIDAKSNKTIASSRVMESVEYVIVFDRSRVSGTQILLSVNGKVASPRLNIPPKTAPKPAPTATPTAVPSPEATTAPNPDAAPAPEPNPSIAVTAASKKGARR